MDRRRFAIRTYGCQMNVHDSEKVANLLHHAGLDAADEAEADVLVVNTCSIRDKAEQRLYTDLGLLRAWKAERPGRLVGVGGCVAQQQGDAILERFPQVDFVFGTHNLRFVPAMVAEAASGQRSARTEETRDLDRFDLPQRHPAYASPSPGRAFVTVMEGCDLYCTFCIVPQTRGREISRPADDIVAEAQTLADEGVCEITLLGQTVNAYGRHDLRRDRADRAGTVAFAELLRRLDRIPGLERIRYTSPHPIFFDAALVRAHGELEHLCPHVHLPLQSGSDAILERMRRRYDRESFLGIAQALRRARPDLTLTSDLIVGFPGESEADLQATLDTVEQAGFADSYSFKYSPRPGTKAAQEPGQIDPGVAQDRLERLQALQRRLTLAYHRSRVGERTEILIEGPSARARRGGPAQVAGRDPHQRVVNLAVRVAGDAPIPQPGERVPVEIVDATPHSLLATQIPLRAVKTAAGSADEDLRNAVLSVSGPGSL
ncbi:MAG: tRNA (N6-isopentenyl adenosine(37)-C2)-methylthiotransferase MiaB [Proteobacteria bacterium]|nr:tRNA (N6-isopentenyl adenosine(37)-C2)-methylthiotransferase MiaB [Pseudomonadota bacterium]